MGGRDPHGYGWPVLVEAQLVTLAVPTVPVGVIDAGVAVVSASYRSYLAGHVDAGDADVESDEDPITHFSGHGPFVAGVVLQHAPMAKVLMRRAVHEDPLKEDELVAEAITELGELAKVINLSFGGGVWEHGTPSNMKSAIENLPADVVVVAAASNNASPLRTFPAAEPSVLAVGATTKEGRIAEFSANGAWIDLYAVGQDVLGPFRGGVALWSGTSFAAAAVTGRLASLVNGGLTAPQAREKLLQSCVPRTMWDVNGEREVLVLR